MHSRLKVRSKQSGARALCLSLIASALLCCVGGCSLSYPHTWIQPKDRIYDKDLSAVYDQSTIKKSLTLDVLPKIESETELLSQSDSVVASLGRGGDGYKTWFTLITFHEFELSVIRKYFFVVDEEVEQMFRKGRGLRFDCEMLLDNKALEEIRAAKELRQIAVLRRVFANLDSDVAELGGDADTPSQNNKMLDISVLLIKQIFDTILRGLDRSPVLATRISDPEGIEFDHINFGRGKIRVWAEGDIAVVKIRIGALLPTFHELQEAAKGD